MCFCKTTDIIYFGDLVELQLFEVEYIVHKS